jgi:hypothetical protein
MKQPLLNQSRNDKFNLILDIPQALKDLTDPVLLSNNQADIVQFTAFGSPVPKIEVKSVDLKFGGQSFQTSSYSRPPWPPLNLKLLIDNRYHNYWILWKWLNLFNDSVNSTSSSTTVVALKEEEPFMKNPLTKYCSNFTLIALDEYNNKNISFTYRDAFITGLSEINYSHQEDTSITVNATFVYNQLYVDLIN